MNGHNYAAVVSLTAELYNYQDLLDIVQDLVTRNVTSHEKADERVVTDRDNVEI